jgi:hypothetical protein
MTSTLKMFRAIILLFVCPKFCAILIKYPGGELEARDGVYELTSEQRLSVTVKVNKLYSWNEI